MMKNYNESVKTNYNPNWPYILDLPNRILIIGVSGSGKTNVLLNLIKHQRQFTKFVCTRMIHSNQSVNCFIKGTEKVGIKQAKYRKAFIVYSQAIDDVY